MRTQHDYTQIPANACTLVVGEFELGDNGDGAKSAPVRLVARSGKPIEHWFWGRVVHDLAGMHLHKPRLPIDYVHDPKEVIGYLNRFDINSGDLVTSGALVPFKDTDRATEIIHKDKAGVPYEASINFGGDGIKVQEIADGEMSPVNGFDFEGPGIIIREWPLRGVAICPYGADQNTESSVLASNNKVFSASVIVPDAAKEEIAMRESVDVVAEVQEPVAEEVEVKTVTEETQDVVAQEEVPEVQDEVAVEDPPAEDTPSVEAPVEATQVPEVVPEPVQTLSREEFTRIADEFGAEIAVQTVRDGGDYQTALKSAHDALKAEVTELRKAAQLGNGTPAKVVEATDPKKYKLFNTGK